MPMNYDELHDYMTTYVSGRQDTSTPPVEDEHGHGPATLFELFQWPKVFCSKLVEGHVSRVQHLKNCHITLTSEFSGMGTAELAIQLVVAALTKHVQHHGGGTGAGGIRRTAFESEV